MARPHRINHPASWHHLWNRGASREVIFHDDQDRRVFLGGLDRASEKFAFETHSFCLLKNHWHVLAYIRTACLSQAMHMVAMSYSKWYHHRYGTDGRLCRGRFGSRNLLNDDEILIASRYVERNALDVAPDLPLGEYRWSSLAAYLGRPPVLASLHTNPILDLAHGTANYMQFLQRPHPSDRRLAPDALVLPDRVVSEDDVERIGSLVDMAFPGRDRASIAKNRGVALLLCTEHLGLTSSHLALRYGYTRATSVRNSVSRARRREMNDAQFAATLLVLRSQLDRDPIPLRRAS